MIMGRQNLYTMDIDRRKQQQARRLEDRRNPPYNGTMHFAWSNAS